MTSLTESFNGTQHTPLYENEQNERVINPMETTVLHTSLESFSILSESTNEAKDLIIRLAHNSDPWHTP